MPSLFLKCRACGKGFPSRIGVNDDALHSVSMSGLTHRCPHCGQEDQYFTADYFVPKASEEVAEPEAAAESHENAAQVQARQLSGYGVGT